MLWWQSLFYFRAVSLVGAVKIPSETTLCTHYQHHQLCSSPCRTTPLANRFLLVISDGRCRCNWTPRGPPPLLHLFRLQFSSLWVGTGGTGSQQHYWQHGGDSKHRTSVVVVFVVIEWKRTQARGRLQCYFFIKATRFILSRYDNLIVSCAGQNNMPARTHTRFFEIKWKLKSRQKTMMARNAIKKKQHGKNSS